MNWKLSFVVEEGMVYKDFFVQFDFLLFADLIATT